MLLWVTVSLGGLQGRVSVSQPVRVPHDQRQCQQAYGEQSTGQYQSLSSLGATDPRLGRSDASTNYTLTLCCQRQDLQSITKPWYATYPNHLSLGAHRNPQPHSCSSTELVIHPAGERHRHEHHVGPYNVWRVQTERILLLSATSCSLSAQAYIPAEPAC